MGSAFKYAAIVHAGLVFPRNETYAPGDLMPIIFGFNDNIDTLIRPQIQYTLSGDGADYTQPAVRFNISTNVLEDRDHHTYLMPFWTDKFAKEGHYKISWTINVQQCDINATDPQNVDFSNGSTHPNGTKPLEFKASTDEDALVVYFTVQAGGLARNLTSIRNDSCHAGPGAAFNVTNLPPIGPTSYEPACVLYDQNRPFTSSSSCNITVDQSMDDDVNFFFQSYHLQEYCNSTNPPKSLPCDKHKNGAIQAVGNGIILTIFAALLTVFLV